MDAVGRITVEHLLRTFFRFPEEIRKDPATTSFTLALGVVKHFLGEDWLETHLSPLVPKPGFMRLGTTGAETSYIQTFKTVDLAELLFNLQHVEGFDECVTRMKTEALVESGLAELDFGRMLFINDHQFKFVAPRGKRGDNYDFEVIFGKWTVCCEVKCKLDDTEISAATVLNVLTGNRDQVPPNKPGVMFIKVPQHWMKKYLFDQLLVESAREFFRLGTQRIVSVKFYIAPLQMRDGYLGQGHVFKEINNSKNRFDCLENWNLFDKYRPRAGHWNTMPPKWLRLVNFPNSLKDHAPPIG